MFLPFTCFPAYRSVMTISGLATTLSVLLFFQDRKSSVVVMVKCSRPTLTHFPDVTTTPHPRFNHLHLHLSLNNEGRWGTTDDFKTSFLHCLISTALWDLANSRPVHSLRSFHLFLFASSVPHFTVPCKMVLARPNDGKHIHISSFCVTLRWSGGLRVVRLLAESWRRPPRW